MQDHGSTESTIPNACAQQGSELSKKSQGVGSRDMKSLLETISAGLDLQSMVLCRVSNGLALCAFSCCIIGYALQMTKATCKSERSSDAVSLTARLEMGNWA